MIAVIELLRNSPVFFVLLCTVLGLAIGSFLNVVIYRLPQMLEREWQNQCAELKGETFPPAKPYNLVVPRSSCPSCGHRIAAIENIPILSYLWLRGHCPQCKAPIGIRYPLVEALSGVLSGYIGWHFGFGAMAFAALLFTWAMIALAAIDLDTQLLPDGLTLPLLWAGLLINLGGTFSDLRSAVIGAAAGYLILWSVFWGFKLATGKEGMGYGDFKLLAAIGAWLGWKMVPLVILLSSLVGAVVGIGLMVFAKHGRNVPIPFGPYLVGGGFIALFWGPDIVNAYLTGFRM